jgi:hypothetical protein
VFVEGRQQKAKLVLKVVQVGHGRVREVGSLEDESLRHVTLIFTHKTPRLANCYPGLRGRLD